MEERMSKTGNLDSFEKGIEENSAKYTPVRGAKRDRIERILERARKTRNVNIRISEHDLAQLKRRAEEEGVPYQTLMSSVLHRFVSERLVDEKDILKCIELLRNRE
jgi:predicted DNA binding CopG/RHH family protein